MHPRPDRSALFEELLERNKRRLAAIARSYAKGDECQDLYQEILLQIWKSLERFEGRSSAATWLYRVALNTALTFRRRAASRLRHSAAADEVVALLPATPSAAASETAILRQFIESLGDVDRALFLLYLEDMTYREMAEVLGLSEGNVGVRINRMKTSFVERYCRR